MGAPQIILLALLFLGAGIHLAKNGETKSQRFCFLCDLVESAVLLGLLYWGGFFG